MSTIWSSRARKRSFCSLFRRSFALSAASNQPPPRWRRQKSQPNAPFNLQEINPTAHTFLQLKTLAETRYAQKTKRLRILHGRRLRRADSAPTGVASERPDSAPKRSFPLRARNGLHFAQSGSSPFLRLCTVDERSNFHFGVRGLEAVNEILGRERVSPNRSQISALPSARRARAARRSIEPLLQFPPASSVARCCASAH